MAVLQAIADGHHFGFDIIDRTRLASGTVYPALAVLARRGLVDSRWEDDARARSERRPRRKYYAVTAEGRETLRASLRRLDEMGLVREPAPGRSAGRE